MSGHQPVTVDITNISSATIDMSAHQNMPPSTFNFAPTSNSNLVESESRVEAKVAAGEDGIVERPYSFHIVAICA